MSNTCPHCKKDIIDQCRAYHVKKIIERHATCVKETKEGEMVEKPKTLVVEILSGVSGKRLSFGDGITGTRLAGPKPYGGARVIYSFTVNVDDMLAAILEYSSSNSELQQSDANDE